MTHPEPETTLERLTRTKPRRYAFYVLLVFLGFSLTFVAASHLDTTTDSYNFTEGAMFAPGDGPVIVLGENVSVNRQYPLTNETVNLLPFAQFTGGTSANATVSNATQPFINISDMNVSAGNLTIDPGDARPLVTVTGGATKLEYRDYEADDGQVDLKLTTSGTTTLNLSELPDSEFITIWNDTTQLDRATVNDGNMATLETDYSGDLYLRTDEPDFSNEEPEDGAFVDQQTDIDLNITVDHPALEQGDSIDVDFYDASDDSLIGSDTLSTQGGEASTTWSVELLGDHEWYAETNDSGRLHESATYSFQTPHNLTIRDENTTDIIKNEGEIEVRFFPGGEEEVITRTTTNGNVSLQGLPTDTEIVVRASMEGYFTREVIIRDLTEQMDIFLLNESEDSAQIVFELDDSTGDFTPEESRILVSKPITMDGTTNYRVIVGQEFGVGGADMTLETDQRYRIVVENENGQERSFGSYVPTRATTETLEIRGRDIGIGTPDPTFGFSWNAVFNESLGDNGGIEFAFEDEDDLTPDLRVTIHERNNEINEIVNETFSDVSDLTSTWFIDNDSQNVSSWVVTISGTHDGTDFELTKQIDVSLDVSLPIPDWLLSMVSFGIVLLVAGLFGSARAEIGGVVAAVLAAFMYAIGFMPGSVTGVLVVFGLMLALAFRYSGGGDQL